MAAAVHLHRFGPGSEVSQDLRNSARIRWVLSWPERHEAAVALMGAARQCIREWASASEYATMVLPIPGFVGVPGVCPHVGAALRAAGFRPEPGDHHREVWGGRIGAAAATPEAPPVEGLRLARAVGHWWQGTELGAVLDSHPTGTCCVSTDLNHVGEVPALGGWAEITAFDVDEAWRNRGVGTWLLRRAVEWMRLAGCDRVVLSVGTDEEGRRASRLYRRFGWDVLAVTERSWVADAR